MDIDSAFKNFTLIFKNQSYEEEFQGREKKAIYTFAFYSSYNLMFLDLGMALYSAIMDAAGAESGMGTGMGFHAIIISSMAFALIFETLTFYITFFQRGRGVCLIICLYLTLCVNFTGQSSPELIVVMYEFL